MSAILNTYNRKKISFKKGKGSFLFSTDGKKYLDFVQGIAVNCLGHANVYLNKAIYKQIVANQAIQAQQISKLVKQNNNVLGKIADKTSRIKYP